MVSIFSRAYCESKMLTKKICYACRKERVNKYDSIWGEDIQYLWDRDRIRCPMFKYTDNDKPPKWCPYFLEHAVSKQC